jgi:hypothetical protein
MNGSETLKRLWRKIATSRRSSPDPMACDI